jgi:hypothetical protein
MTTTTMLPTYAARNGQKGVWYIDVDEYAKQIAVLHHTLIGPGNVPWAHQFLIGNKYDQHCHVSHSWEKAAQAKRINQLKLVVLTRDFWSSAPVPNSGGMHIRMPDNGYVGVFEAFDATFARGHLKFTVGAQLCHLLKPSAFV